MVLSGISVVLTTEISIESPTEYVKTKPECLSNSVSRYFTPQYSLFVDLVSECIDNKTCEGLSVGVNFVSGLRKVTGLVGTV